ncbi:MAG: D-alanyl-D-alanine carboxypeptidase/D-alanyl-D-alanine endopeptidase [Bacteroidia bacterium]
MKHFFNKTLKVKQVVALIIFPVAIVATIFVFSNGGNPVLLLSKKTNDSTSVKPVSDTSALGQLNAYVDSLNNAKELFGGTWSFYLTDVDSGKAICNVDFDRGMMPASVMKVLTTGAALSILGPGYHFYTTIQYDGTIDPATKILNGNIYIHGGGDPALGAETFGSSIDTVKKQWVTAIKKAGIDSISGSIIGDAQCFDNDPIPIGWTWGDIQSDYGTGPCGLNIHENLYELLLTASKDGNINIKTNPAIPGMKLYNQVLHNPTIPKSYAYVQGAPFQFERTVFGEVSSELIEHGSIPDPALFCAQLLKAALQRSGVGVRDSVSTMRLMRLNNIKTEKKESRKIIASYSSPSLDDLVYHTNQVSQNFYAESMLRAIALKQSGYGNTASGVNSIYEYLKSKNVDLHGLCMVDGCGLSRMNSVSTHQLVEILRVYAKDPNVFPSFYRSLPIAGESGTIRKLADGTLADGNLRAKSGTMSRVKSYAGYVKTKSGKMLCFAMIGNNTQWNEIELKFKFEKLFELMAGLP